LKLNCNCKFFETMSRMLKLREASLDALKKRYKPFKVKFKQPGKAVEVYMPQLDDFMEVTTKNAQKYLRRFDLTLDARSIHEEQEALRTEHGLPEDAFDLNPLPGEKWFCGGGKDILWMKTTHFSNFGRLRKELPYYGPMTLSYIELPWLQEETNTLMSGNPKVDFNQYRWAYGKDAPDADLEERASKFRNEVIPEVSSFDADKSVPGNKFSVDTNMISFFKVGKDVLDKDKMLPYHYAMSFVNKYSANQTQCLNQNAMDSSIFQVTELDGEKWFSYEGEELGRLRAISSKGRVLQMLKVSEKGWIFYIQIPKAKYGKITTYVKIGPAGFDTPKEELKFAKIHFEQEYPDAESVAAQFPTETPPVFTEIEDFEEFLEDMGTVNPFKNERFVVVAKNYTPPKREYSKKFN